MTEPTAARHIGADRPHYQAPWGCITTEQNEGLAHSRHPRMAGTLRWYRPAEAHSRRHKRKSLGRCRCHRALQHTLILSELGLGVASGNRPSRPSERQLRAGVIPPQPRPTDIRHPATASGNGIRQRHLTFVNRQ